MALARGAGDRTLEGQALCALAESQQRLGDTDTAAKSLESYLELMKLEDPRARPYALPCVLCAIWDVLCSLSHIAYCALHSSW